MSNAEGTPPPSDWRIPEADLQKDPTTIFKKVEKLGEGSYGSVYKAIHNATGYLVAIKEVVMEDDWEDIIKEIDIMAQLSSPFIVNYYGHYKRENELWIVMEYCGAGSISDMMGLCKECLNEEQIAIIMHDSLKGLEYLHSKNKIHRDIKAGNILVSDRGEGKLADFGVSGQLKDDDAKRNTVIGTPYWMAPEIVQEIGYNCAVDIWSLGITCIEMADSRPPLSNIHPMRAIFMIPARPPPTVTKPDDWSGDFNDFIAKCLVKDPGQRSTATALLTHSFITKPRNRDTLLAMMRKANDAIAAKGRLFNEEDNASGDDSDEGEGGVKTVVKGKTPADKAETALLVDSQDPFPTIKREPAPGDEKRIDQLVKMSSRQQTSHLNALPLDVLKQLLADIDKSLSAELEQLANAYQRKKTLIESVLEHKREQPAVAR